MNKGNWGIHKGREENFASLESRQNFLRCFYRALHLLFMRLSFLNICGKFIPESWPVVGQTRYFRDCPHEGIGMPVEQVISSVEIN
jgi:hypothetical protein